MVYLIAVRVNIMKKLLLVVLASLIISGLIAGPLAKAFNKHCHQGCDCCGEVCDCQPQICNSSWQPLINTETSSILTNLFPKQTLQYVYLDPYSDEAIRLIFHPPRKLS